MPPSAHAAPLLAAFLAHSFYTPRRCAVAFRGFLAAAWPAHCFRFSHFARSDSTRFSYYRPRPRRASAARRAPPPQQVGHARSARPSVSIAIRFRFRLAMPRRSLPSIFTHFTCFISSSFRRWPAARVDFASRFHKPLFALASLLLFHGSRAVSTSSPHHGHGFTAGRSASARFAVTSFSFASGISRLPSTPRGLSLFPRTTSLRAMMMALAFALSRQPRRRGVVATKCLRRPPSRAAHDASVVPLLDRFSATAFRTPLGNEVSSRSSLHWRTGQFLALVARFDKPIFTIDTSASVPCGACVAHARARRHILPRRAHLYGMLKRHYCRCYALSSISWSRSSG